MSARVIITIEREFEQNLDGLLDQILALSATRIDVDTSTVSGRALLASLQTRAERAFPLEKRERPTLPEVQRIEALSKECEHLDDLRTLIRRLD